jgi:hypothetical protein
MACGMLFVTHAAPPALVQLCSHPSCLAAALLRMHPVHAPGAMQHSFMPQTTGAMQHSFMPQTAGPCSIHASSTHACEAAPSRRVVIWKAPASVPPALAQLGHRICTLLVTAGHQNSGCM